MLAIYRASQSVILNFSLVSDDGSVLTPSSASYQVLNEFGAEVVASTLITLDGTESSLDVIVTAAQNEVGEGEISGLRRVILTLTVDSIPLVREQKYIIESENSVVVGKNSVQTYEEALLVTRSLSGLAAFSEAEENDQKTALVEAYYQMSNIVMSFYSADFSLILRGSVSSLSDTDLANLYSSQLLAIKRAQVLQADFLLGGNSTEQNRLDGLASHTIGETSVFFKPRPQLVMPICRRAMDVLAPYVSYAVKIGRG